MEIDRERIREAREQAGLTRQDVVAEAMAAHGERIALETVRELERGRGEPELRTVAVVCAVVGVTLDDVVKP